MAYYLTDDAICLRVTDFSETSQIVGLFTRRHGLVPLIAKGAKRQSKKNAMSGPLDLLTSGEVVFVPAKEGGGGGSGAGGGGGGGGLGTLAEWELTNHRAGLRSQLAALNAAMLCAEVTTHLVHPNDPHEDLYGELEAALDLLEMPAQRARGVVAYVKAALAAAGYWPRFAACMACGRPVADGLMRFSSQAGGVLCASGDCQSHGAGGGRPAGTTIGVNGRIVLALDRLALPSVMREAPPQRVADEGALQTAMRLLLGHVEALTDKGLRTRFLVAGIFGVKEKDAAR